mmetsp:Transcript_16105/g.20449  ORF Transcript_16105/g.20449 Transcript_16105/m.20449 type:complete len:83 (-) Transcript_16105:104-352(-)|eukprot:CAMPEP_0170456166 /NCGR_PEP_ID=MMETSP0123-20130129/3890_1 /TAXON_ID=182087 /ORGANISM="Favella ehrenbergii, Strain Fehren 1" /LENGTH=82 /DNA_ID=CAMNT_0010719551 /DNA_START=948 /DNA_END=1196 /DNA_ORIENTATION=+
MAQKTVPISPIDELRSDLPGEGVTDILDSIPDKSIATKTIKSKRKKKKKTRNFLRDVTQTTIEYDSTANQSSQPFQDRLGGK